MNAPELLQPLLVALVGVATTAITAGTPLLLFWIGRHLAIANTASGAAILSAANATIQTAAQNAAGSVLHSIQSGDLDVLDRASVSRALAAAALTIEHKVPSAIALAAPAAGTLADLVAQKFALQQSWAGAPAAAAAASPPAGA